MNKLLLIAGMLLVSHSSFAAEYLVKYKSNSVFTVLSSQQHLQVLDQHEDGQLFNVNIDEKNKLKVLAKLLSSPAVEYVVPNSKMYALTAPIDSQGLQAQWANAKVNATQAWARAGNKGSRKVLVAVIDTGVDYNHKDLLPNMVQGYNFRNNNNDPMDVTSAQNPGHGTHCAGSIGASGLIEGGIEGISPEVSIMPLRFLGEDGSGDLNAAIKAIDYAISKKVDVISASWGATIGRSQAQPLIEAIKRADDAGIIFVAAAANDGKNNDKTEVYPANAGLPNMISVAASGPNDEKPSWSNYVTRTVNLASPGLDIISTLPGSKYGKLSGTSMATPLVAGLVAFLKSQDASLTGAQAKALLQATGAQVQIQTACNCRVDAFAAVDALMSKKMIVVPNAATYSIGETAQFTTMNGQAPFTFNSSNPSAATIDDKGVLTAVAVGETRITVSSADGQVASTLAINVGETSSGTNPGNPGECPIGDPALCQIMCGIMPTLPFCQQ